MSSYFARVFVGDTTPTSTDPPASTTSESPNTLVWFNTATATLMKWTGSSWVSAEGGGGSIPAGIICMWGGLLVNIPSGWLLCDGTLGTPDLRSIFIKGAAAGVNPGLTGGASGHTHAVGTLANASSAVSGTSAAESAHTHSVTSNVAVGNHAFTQPTVAWPAGVPTQAADTFGTTKFTTSASGTAAFTSETARGAISWPAGVPTNSLGAVDAHAVTNNAVTSTAGSSHSHGAGTFTAAAQSLTGTTASASSEPAYYSLAFIQKA